MELTDLDTQTQAQAGWVSEWTWPSGTWMQWEGWAILIASWLSVFACSEKMVGSEI